MKRKRIGMKSAKLRRKPIKGRKLLAKKGAKIMKKVAGGGRKGTKQIRSYNQAYDAGFDTAYNEGFNVGYAEGMEAGHQDAYKGE